MTTKDNAVNATNKRDLIEADCMICLTIENLDR